MSSSDSVIALDVGGSSVKSGVVRLADMAVSGRTRTPLDSKGAAGAILASLSGCILAHAETVNAGGVALAFPGPFEYDTGVCRIAGVSKFESIYGLDIGRELAHRTGFDRAQIAFVNDAEAAIAGEIAYGAGRGVGRVIGVTLGTGMGSGFFLDGIRVSSGEGVPDNGGWLFDGRFGGAMADGCFSIRGLEKRLAAAGIKGRNPEQAAADARAGGLEAQTVFAAFGRDLGTFLDRYAVAFRADAVLVGGGLSGAFDLFGPSLAAALSTSIRRGALGMDAPLLGAVDAFLRKRGTR